MAQPLTPSSSISKHTNLMSMTTKPSPSSIFLFFITLCILGLYTFFNTHHHSSSISSDSINHLRFRNIFLSSATNSTIASYLRALTLHPHLAGTDLGLQTARYVQSQFEDLGLNTHTTSYGALLSYPVHASLSAHFSNGSVSKMGLTEPGFAGGSEVVQPYHAYSPSGSAYAKVVFANYGREEDYRALLMLGVNVSGCVVIVRRGEFSRGGVVEKAAEKGAAAVLMYAEMGKVKEGGVERGTVLLKGVGDPVSPGWAGVEGGESLSLENLEVSKRFPKIPSLPISTQNAYTILGSLEGPRVPYEWRDTLRLKARRVGPGPTRVNFTYQGEKKMEKIHNVFAVIRGLEEPDRYVLLGNHRDAWTYGAVDPNSGTAALLDIARRYALLMRSGWIPRRTIVLCSWDAEEFGMIGSTEWVEQNLLHLGSKAVVYLNVDCAVQGPGLFASTTPQLDDLLVEITKKVKDPDSEDMTVFEKWTTTNRGVNIQRLSGVDSDFAPFLQHAGVPSVDIYYGRDFPVYHTAYDSYNWMANVGDPLFQRHVAVSGLWGLLALHLADDPILPFNYASYVEQLLSYVNVLSNLLEESISLHPLTASIEELASASKDALEEAKKLGKQESKGDLLMLKRRALNDRLMLAERGFLDVDGLQERPWFKHLIYGPPSDFENKLGFFPGIANAMSISARINNRSERQAAIQHEIWRVARAIQRAASALKGDLT